MASTSRLAVASLVLGILSLILGWLLLTGRLNLTFGWILGWASLILAIVLGFVALSKIKKDQNLEGKGVAIAGLIIGFISFGFFIWSLISGEVILSHNLEAIYSSQLARAAGYCPGRCYKANPPSGSPAGIYSDAACNADFETRLSGASIPRNMPKTDNPSQYRCDECCILTG